MSTLPASHETDASHFASPLTQPVAARATTTHCFAVHAMADPTVLSRVVGVLAKRGLTPSRWAGATVGDEMQIDLQLTDVDANVARLVAQEMRAIVNVSTVMTSEKLGTVAA